MGPANFAKLRRAATTALVGPWHNASTMLSCAAVSSYLVDPLLYVVISMLRALQKWYWKSPDRVMAFCERVHAFDGDRAIGSASLCALYLREVGLTLGPTGLVSGTAGVSFCIQCVDKTELERSLHYVWTCRIMHGVGGRKGIPTQVPFDLQTTREAFRALPRHVQKSAVMNITGVAVSGARKFHQCGPINTVFSVNARIVRNIESSSAQLVMSAEVAILRLSHGSVTSDPNGHILRWLTNAQQNPSCGLSFRAGSCLRRVAMWNVGLSIPMALARPQMCSQPAVLLGA